MTWERRATMLMVFFVLSCLLLSEALRYRLHSLPQTQQGVPQPPASGTTTVQVSLPARLSISVEPRLRAIADQAWLLSTSKRQWVNRVALSANPTSRTSWNGATATLTWSISYLGLTAGDLQELNETLGAFQDTFVFLAERAVPYWQYAGQELPYRLSGTEEVGVALPPGILDGPQARLEAWGEEVWRALTRGKSWADKTSIRVGRLSQELTGFDARFVITYAELTLTELYELRELKDELRARLHKLTASATAPVSK